MNLHTEITSSVVTGYDEWGYVFKDAFGKVETSPIEIKDKIIDCREGTFFYEEALVRCCELVLQRIKEPVKVVDGRYIDDVDVLQFVAMNNEGLETNFSCYYGDKDDGEKEEYIYTFRNKKLEQMYQKKFLRFLAKDVHAILDLTKWIIDEKVAVAEADAKEIAEANAKAQAEVDEIKKLGCPKCGGKIVVVDPKYTEVDEIHDEYDEETNTWKQV